MAHPNKDIRNAIEYAKSKGFRYIEGGKSHLKGVLLCAGGRGACRIPVYGTPRNAGDHAKDIRREADKCNHNERKLQ